MVVTIFKGMFPAPLKLKHTAIAAHYVCQSYGRRS